MGFSDKEIWEEYLEEIAEKEALSSLHKHQDGVWRQYPESGTDYSGEYDYSTHDLENDKYE